MKTLDEFLDFRDYRSYSPSPPEEGKARCWARTIRDGPECGDNRRFIHITEWDLRHIPVVNIKDLVYDVEMTCCTSVGRTWFTSKFYGLSADKLRFLLPEMEEKLGTVFRVIGGEYQ